MNHEPVGACAPLLKLLAEPRLAMSLDLAGWSRLIALARSCNLLGTLAERLAKAGLQAPPAPQRHLQGALQLAARQRLSVRWEAEQLQRALGDLGEPVLLLKGAAYVIGDEPAGEGRMFGDIDILVPRAAIGDVEMQLMLNGFVSAKAEDYDQRYYREWMHELPPMTHLHRGTVIDVHHTLLPPTGRHHADVSALLARSRPAPGLPALRLPAPEDLVIHSLLHLVHEGELHHGLRDLCDVDRLLRAFAASEADFWSRFEQAALTQGLAAPLLLGLSLLRQEFATPLPETLLQRLRDAAGRAPSRWLLALYHRAMHAMAPGARAGLASWLLYVRSHALRMPMGLLLRHLLTKAWMRWRQREETPVEA
jgi:hypothetical protein